MSVQKEELTKEMKQLIHAAVQEVKGNAPPETLAMIEETLFKTQVLGYSPKEAMGIPEDWLEEVYLIGYNFFQSGKYERALTIFHLLALLVAGRDPRFTFAIAASYHHMKQYPDAISYYMLYQILDLANPLSYYHIFDCFKNMDNPYLAIKALKTAKELANKDPKYAQLLAKIDLELTTSNSAVAVTKAS